jgi:hypothetical protein
MEAAGKVRRVRGCYERIGEGGGNRTLLCENVQTDLERHAPRLVRLQDEVEENDQRPGNYIRLVKNINKQQPLV